MAGIADTVARLAKLRVAAPLGFVEPTDRHLRELSDFGQNPGRLFAKMFIPDGLPSRAPLVVVLHGCTQNATGYDRGAGWSQLALEAGFALLYPEQHRSNNANLCFNWFEHGDITRGHGEIESIREMVMAMIAGHDLDPARVYVTGLSAGGAMASAVLAAYPDVFTGGAIIAGLPFGAAQGLPQALRSMRAAEPARASQLGQELRATSGHQGAWPSISVWHGDADHIVHASNGVAIVEQWRAIHAAEHGVDQRISGRRRQVWRDPAGREVIEFWRIAGMGHGTPLATSGPEACGATGPHMLEAGISSTRHIARFWGLLPALDAAAAENAPFPPVTPAANPNGYSGSAGVTAMIEDALRSAGLMK